MSNSSTSNASKQICSKLQNSTVEVIKSSNGLPKIGDGYELYASYSDYAQLMAQLKSRTVAAMGKLLAGMGCKVKIPQSGLKDMEKIIYANDLLVEKAATFIEQHNAALTQRFLENRALQSGAEVVPGCSTITQPPITADGQGPYPSEGVKYGGRYAVLGKLGTVSHVIGYSAAIEKPQIKFLDYQVNADKPFLHKLNHKYNAMQKTDKMCNLKIIDEQDKGQNNLWGTDKEIINQMVAHPYQQELDCFSVPKNQLFLPPYVQSFLPVEDTPLVLVDTKTKLEEMILVLNSVQEFAVDLEHHDHRSFLGLTCLVQISTRTTDYVIDPFPLWKEMWRLNEPFTNPKIVKVFHGATCDLMWLQKSFGVYTINICDTHVFLKTLDFEGKLGLKDLVKQECGVTLKKDMQKADWRERPLSQNHLLYARLDTHYLLYCYDKLRIQLVEQDASALLAAFEECHKMSYALFQQPRLDQNGHILLARNSKQPFNNRQLEALRLIYKWRDSTARKQDESVHYVIQKHMMIQISEALPRDVQGILACCAPVPPLVKHDVATILRYLNSVQNLPLEPCVISAPSKSLDSNSYFSNSKSVEDENRITARKAKLEYAFDCSSFIADKEIPSIESRLRKLDKATFVRAKDESQSAIQIAAERGDIGEKLKKHNVEESPNQAAAKHGTAEKIKERLNQIATPYQRYLLKQAKKEQQICKPVK